MSGIADSAICTCRETVFFARADGGTFCTCRGDTFCTCGQVSIASSYCDLAVVRWFVPCYSHSVCCLFTAGNYQAEAPHRVTVLGAHPANLPLTSGFF